MGNVLLQLGTALGVDASTLVMSDEEYQSVQQQMLQQQMAQQMASPLAQGAVQEATQKG